MSKRKLYLEHRGAYSSWTSMKTRCDNTKRADWPLYGGRGITYCDRWYQFKHFLADMGDRPEGHSIERIDVNGNYEPGNCQWIPRSHQSKNRRVVKKLTVGDVTLSQADWARRNNLLESTICRRLASGWSPAMAVLPGSYRSGGLMKYMELQQNGGIVQDWDE